MMGTIAYSIPIKGLGTELSLPKESLEYARVFRNRFINLNQEAEKRQGLKDLLTNDVAGQPRLNAVHEYIDDNNVSVIFVSGEGKIWKANTVTQTWDLVLSGKDTSSRMVSVQFGRKMIFVNGVDRNFYSEDSGVTWKELLPIVTAGSMGAGTTTTRLFDAQIASFISQTDVSQNDLVFDADASAYAIITSVGTSSIDMTQLGGAGATGIGVGSSAQSGHQYQVIDLVALNIIPTKLDPDNVALMTSAGGVPVNSSSVAVSGVDFSTTQMRVGDYIYNSTRNAVTQVLSVSAGLRVTDVSGQVAGDTAVFLKKAMPISDWAHIHFKRLYLTDVRDRVKVRVSGVDDPQDFTTYQKTLESTSIDYGARYKKGSAIKSITTFHKFIAAGSNQQIFLDEGFNPIVDVCGQTTNLDPAGTFDQGVVTRYGFANVGSDMLYASFDGLRSFRASFDSGSPVSDNLSEAIKSDLRQAIGSQITSPDNIQLIHYYRRNWVMFKVGDLIYNYNYTPMGESQRGTWSVFQGKLPECTGFLVRNNGDLICCNQYGKVFLFDNGNYDDDGEPIQTELETLWMTLQEPQGDMKWKSGKYILPTMQTGAEITYTIVATGGYDSLSTDTIQVTGQSSFVIGQAVINLATIGGTAILDRKLPLRWRGEQFKLRFSTNDTKGNDIISEYSVYGELDGRT